MSNFGRAVGFMTIVTQTNADQDRRRAEEWQQLHRRPDAEPMPSSPVRPGRVDRPSIATRLHRLVTSLG